MEGEGFFGFKDIDSDFGCCCEQFWNFVRTTQFGTLLEQPNFGTSLEQQNLELRENNQILVVLTKLDFVHLALKMALKVIHDLRFEIYGLHWLYGPIFRG